MRFVSIDIETTGLNPETCQILEVGAVIEDTNDVLPIGELPTFSCIVEHPEYVGSAYAINLNHRIFNTLALLDEVDKELRTKLRTDNYIMSPSLVPKALAQWLMANGIKPREDSKTNQIRITAAGKNFASFDKKFLEKLPGWTANIQINQRIIDPAFAFTDWKNDEVLPNLETCMKRVNIYEPVTHIAVDDALDVIRVIRKITNDYEKNLF